MGSSSTGKESADAKWQLVSEICKLSKGIILCSHQHLLRPKESAFIDWYRVLDIDESAGVDVIKQRYCKLVLQLHPDKNKHPKAEIAFKLVSQAYVCLIDEETREAFETDRRNHICPGCSIHSSEKSPRHGNIAKVAKTFPLDNKSRFRISMRPGKRYEIGIYEIKKGDFSVKITNYGGRIISVLLPDKNGKIGDVVLGYDTIEEYKNDKSYFGAVLGRVANRIGGAQFTLNGTHYKLVPNEGKNMLHGGPKGFSSVVWKVIKYVPDGPNPCLTLTYHSPDGDNGFPGDVLASVTYALKDPYKLSVVFKAKALNKATPINLSHHPYWNIGGHDSGDILSQVLQLFGSHITPVDKELIPTGEIAPVKNTPYDFLKPRKVGSRIDKLQNGYDINYVLDSKKKMKHVAVVYDKKSGRVMDVQASAPGVQFYTANGVKNTEGKGGFVYQPHSALSLETLVFPDAVNHPNFPSTIVNPGKNYVHNVLYTFSIKK